MSDKNPHTSERIQDSHHQGGAPFSNPRRSQTSTTVQHVQEESPAQNSLPPQGAGPDAPAQTPQAAQDPQGAKTQESAEKSAEGFFCRERSPLPNPRRGAHRLQNPSLPRPRTLNPPPLRSIRTPLRRRFPRAFRARTLTRLFTTKIRRPVSCRYRADLSRAR